MPKAGEADVGIRGLYFYEFDAAVIGLAFEGAIV
jgi:hypothetical protein